MNAVNVEKLSVGSHLLLNIREHTLGRAPMSAVTVGKCLVEAHPLLNIRESTLEKSLMSVESVGRASVEAHPLLFTRELTPEKSLTNVMTVGKPSVRVQLSSDISNFTLKSNVCAFINVSTKAHTHNLPQLENKNIYIYTPV